MKLLENRGVIGNYLNIFCMGHVQDGGLTGRSSWSFAGGILNITPFLGYRLPPEFKSGLQMPYKSSGRGKGGKKLSFPPVIPAKPSLEPWVEGGPSPRANMVLQTDLPEEAVVCGLGIPEVMAAIASCQAALTNKTEAVQLDIGLIRQYLDKVLTRPTTA